MCTLAEVPEEAVGAEVLMGLLPALPMPAPRCSSLSPETPASAQSLHTPSVSLATDLSRFNKHPSQALGLWLFLALSFMWSGTNAPLPQSPEQRPGLGWRGLGMASGAGLAKTPEGSLGSLLQGDEARPGNNTGGMSSVLKEGSLGGPGGARQLQEPGGVLREDREAIPEGHSTSPNNGEWGTARR